MVKELLCKEVINLHDIDCPYGASDCPKVNELRKMLAQNHEELDAVKESVIQLRTTISFTGKVLGVLVSVLIAFMGAMNICLL